MIAAAIVAAVSLGLGLHRLAMPSLWFDEAYTWHNVARDWSAYWHEVTSGEDCGGFVYSFLLKLWTIPFGAGEFALRLPSVLYFVGMLLVLLQIGRELHSLSAGFWMALLAAFNPEVIVWSRQARAYSLEMFLTAAYFLVLLRYSRTHDAKRGALTAVVGTLLSLTHIFGVFVVAGSTAYLIVSRFRPGSFGDVARRMFVVWPTIVPLPILAFWTFAIRRRIDGNLNYFWPHDSLADSYASLFASFGLACYLTLGCFVIGGVRWLLGRSNTSERRLLAIGGWIATAVFLGPLVVSMLSRGTHHFIVARYHYPALVVMFVLAGYYLGHCRPRVVLIAVLLLGGVDFVRSDVERFYGSDGYDWGRPREAAAYIAAHRRPDDTVLIVPREERVTAGYYGIDGPTTRTVGTYDNPADFAELTRADPPPAPGSRKWVLIFRQDSARDLRDYGLHEAPQIAFGSVRLVRIEGDSVPAATNSQ